MIAPSRIAEIMGGSPVLGRRLTSIAALSEAVARGPSATSPSIRNIPTLEGSMPPHTGRSSGTHDCSARAALAGYHEDREFSLPDTLLPLETTPLDIQRRLAAGEKLVFIDVREPNEFQTACISGAELIPMRTVPAQLQRLEAASDDATLIVLCHHGIRSLNVVNWLRDQGVTACQSMAGGIDRWSLEIDSSVPRYS